MAFTVDLKSAATSTPIAIPFIPRPVVPNLLRPLSNRIPRDEIPVGPCKGPCKPKAFSVDFSDGESSETGTSPPRVPERLFRQRHNSEPQTVQQLKEKLRRAEERKKVKASPVSYAMVVCRLHDTAGSLAHGWDHWLGHKVVRIVTCNIHKLKSCFHQ